MDAAVQRKTNSPNYSTAYFFLEGLSELGIEYLFCNFGTDHAPIIEEIAHRRKRGDALPTIIRCPHENTAAHMAAGYAFVTGRGQGVLVHVDVGTASGMADAKLVAELADRLIAAEHPILITGYAGRNPAAAALIIELAEFAGIAVFESNMTNNISHDSPCFVGFAPDKHLPQTDVGILVDVDVPWFPSE